MLRNAEFKSFIASGVAPEPDDILPGTHVRRVPLLVFRIPHVEVVMVHSHAYEILRAGFFIEFNEFLRFETFGFPMRDRVFIAEFRRMTVGFDVLVVLRASLHVHVPRIPIAVFNRGLRSPVRPNTELRVMEPFGNFVLTQRVAAALEWTAESFDSGGRFRLDPAQFKGGSGAGERANDTSSGDLH